MKIVSWNLARNTRSKSWSVHEQAWDYLAPALTALRMDSSTATVTRMARKR